MARSRARPKGDTKMQPYKQHPIYGIAVSEPGKRWRPKGLVFASDLNCTLEIQRLEPSDLNFKSKKEAEEQALKLCKAWIDAKESESHSRAKGSDSAKARL
jgi:hypothetical protein